MRTVPSQTVHSQTLIELALAVATAGVLAATVASGDAFRGTLVMVPLVVAALRAIERLAGARVLKRQEGRMAAIALGVLILVTLHRHRLGLVVTDWFLAAGFFLLLAHRTARLLVGLRPSLGQRLPRCPPVAFFLLPWVVYLAIQPWSSAHRQPDGDEPYYLLLAHSLAYDLDVDLSDNYAEDWSRFMERAIEPQPGDPVGDAGEQFSRHGFVLPLVLAPGYRLAGRYGAMALMAALTAALGWMMLRLAGHYTPRYPGAALMAYGVFAFSPPLLLYSYQIWVEVPAALLLTLALDRMQILRRRSVWTARSIAALVVPIALLPILKMRFGLLAGPLLILALWRLRPRRSALAWVVGGLATATAAVVLFNVARFDNPLRLYSWSELDLLKYSAEDFARGGVGMLYDSAFGLFLCAPIWLLLLPAVGLALKRRHALLMDLAIVSLPYLVFIAPRIEWFGGWAPAFRYPLVFLPLLALALVPLLEDRWRPSLRALIAGLAAVTLVLSMIWVVFPGWTYNFADGRTHLLDQASVRLSADISRFFPSTVRPRAATWLWLAGSILLVPLGAWWGRRDQPPRRRSRATAVWGVTGVLALLPVLVLASRALPTKIVHFEDSFVTRPSGSVYPPLWVLQRPIYIGGWLLPARAEGLRAPVTAGGDRVEILLSGRVDHQESTMDLWIGAGETHLATWTVKRGWADVTLGPFDWPAGEPLVIRNVSDSGAVIMDRAELQWQ